MRICTPYSSADAAAGACSSALRCACITLRAMRAVKGGWAQKLPDALCALHICRSFVLFAGWSVNDKIMEQTKKNLYQIWNLHHDCKDTALDQLLMRLNLM